MLHVNQLNAAYGDIQVLWDVNIAIDEGQIVAIVGSNGAGKTTLLRVISGLMAPLSGSISYQNRTIHDQPSHDIVRQGIIHVPEGRKLFPEMTVEENLLMGAYSRREDVSADLKNAYELFPRLQERRQQKAGSLSGGEQQMAALARGMLGKPRCFLIDEMSLGLAPLIVDNLVETVQEINRQGATVLLVEQDVQLALENAHYAYVLDTGRVVKEGPAQDLLQDPEIKGIYLGL